MSYITYAKIAITAYSILNRSSNPNTKLLISITKMLASMNIKLDAIFEGIESLHDDLQEVKHEVLKTPLKTISEGNRAHIATISAHIDDIIATKQYYNQFDLYYSQLFEEYKKLASEIKLHAELCEKSGFDDILTLLLEYNSQLELAYELMSFEAFENGVEFPVVLALQTIRSVKRIANASLKDRDHGLNELYKKLKKQLDDYYLADDFKYSVSKKKVHLPALLQEQKSFVGATVLYRPGPCLQRGRYNNYCYEPGPEIPYETGATITLSKKPNDFLDRGLPYENIPVLEDINITPFTTRNVGGDYLIKGKSVGNAIRQQKEKYNFLVSQYMTVLFTKVFIEDSLADITKLENEILEVLE